MKPPTRKSKHLASEDDRVKKSFYDGSSKFMKKQMAKLRRQLGKKETSI
jgi:hypothetical protein